jgi:hypothetical protein
MEKKRYNIEGFEGKLRQPNYMGTKAQREMARLQPL